MADLTIKECYSFHRSAFEVWRFGEPVESWKENNILCIRYASGVWFHYHRNGGYIEFW